MRAEASFPVMGTTARIVVVGGRASSTGHAERILRHLEHRWSRFRPDSDVARLNRAAGDPVPVAPETVTLVRLACAAWERTGGAFDPTVHDAVVAAGYARSFADLPDDVDGHEPLGRTPGCRGIVVDASAGTVTLPPGVRLDAGGIGKGLAADLVVEELRGQVEGLCVEVGGDLRCAGRSPGASGWRVDVEWLPGVILVVSDGAVTTSSTARRRWLVNGEPRSHVIDPRTGGSATTELASVTVVAGRAWRADAWATAATVGPTLDEARRLLSGAVDGALLVTADSKRDVLGCLEKELQWIRTLRGTSLVPVASSPGD